MPAFFLFTVATTIAGVGLLAAMHRRDDPFLGVLALIALCVSGISGAAYGMLVSIG